MTPASTLLVDRPTYLDRLWKRRHNGMVKVIQGPRRCGKSTLLKLFQMRLRDRGVGADHLVSFNLEDRVHASLLTADALHDAVMQKVGDSGMHYVFIDEVQMCPGFERAVDSLILRENIDLYITGSNAFMLSGELATLLTGRYMPLEVMPLSFSEYRSGTVSDGLSVEEDFQQYIRGGSFPALLKYRHDETYVDDYYQMLQNSMIVKDIAIRHQFKKIDLLERLTRFLASGVGNIISARKIADTLSSEKEDVSNRTISDYLKALAESYFFLAVPRFDVVGRQLLRGNEYMVSSLIARAKSCYLGTTFPEGAQTNTRALIQLCGEATSCGNVDRLSEAPASRVGERIGLIPYSPARKALRETLESLHRLAHS